MAGYRPADWHVLDLDKDPTPGDPDRVRQLARTLHDFADDVVDALRLIKGMASENETLEWAGKTAEVFQDEFSDVPKNLKERRSRTACAATRWWTAGRSWSGRRPSPTGRWPLAMDGRVREEFDLPDQGLRAVVHAGGGGYEFRWGEHPDPFSDADFD